MDINLTKNETEKHFCLLFFFKEMMLLHNMIKNCINWISITVNAFHSQLKRKAHLIVTFHNSVSVFQQHTAHGSLGQWCSCPNLALKSYSHERERERGRGRGRWGCVCFKVPQQQCSSSSLHWPSLAAWVTRTERMRLDEKGTLSRWLRLWHWCHLQSCGATRHAE